MTVGLDPFGRKAPRGLQLAPGVTREGILRREEAAAREVRSANYHPRPEHVGTTDGRAGCDVRGERVACA